MFKNQKIATKITIMMLVSILVVSTALSIQSIFSLKGLPILAHSAPHYRLIRHGTVATKRLIDKINNPAG